MDFLDVLDQVVDLLRQRRRLTYRTIKLQFSLNDEYLETLKDELIKGQRLAIDEDGEVLVWVGETEGTSVSTSQPAPTTELLSSATDQKPPPISYTPQYLTEKILTSRSALEGERKQVTVMFADIKDSTELIHDLDPEAAQQLLDPAIHIMMEAVHRFEGTVNQVLGDGIMALFGAPVSHEDHAARACYAALTMQASMRDYTETIRRTQGLELRIRVGLNSGEVVVRTIGNDLHMDYSAVGPTTHLASRMEQLATAGSIRLSSSTLRLVEGLVQVNDLGPVPVKGITDPVEIYELTGAGSIRRRLQAAAARGLTKFVGRDIEIEALNQALEKTATGHGQIVATFGEAGVGKSRLIYEFIHSHRTQGWLVLESASVSYGKATPYFPVVDLLKHYLHVEDSDDARTIRAKVTGQILTLDESLKETIPALLSLLDALPDDSSFFNLDPPQRRLLTLDGLKRILLCESQIQPLLLVFEDLHWIDSETQALLDGLVESLPTAQMLLLVNYRPDYRHDWGSKTYYTQLRLDPLPTEGADALLAALLGTDASLGPLKPLLIERTHGNPFFLEETVRTLFETEVLAGEAGAYELIGQLPSIQVPDTVQAILAARIDRLPQEEKQLLQTAAVIGTDIALPLIRAISDLPEDVLQRGLAQLQAAEFVYATQLFPELQYTFKHALTHEVAYGSLLQERRRGLHARLVEALEGLTGENLSDHTEALARHAFRGEVWNKAFTYGRQAGLKMMNHSAYREAVAYFEQALAAEPHLAENYDTVAQAIDLRFDLRNALFPLSEDQRILNDMQEGAKLAESLGDKHRLATSFGHQSFSYFRMGNYEEAVAVAQQALSLAIACEDFDLEIASRMRTGLPYYAMGSYAQAMEPMSWIIKAITGNDVGKHFGNVILPAVASRAMLALSLAEVGRFAESIAVQQEGLRIAETSEHPLSHAMGSLLGGFSLLQHGELLKAISILEPSLSLFQGIDARVYISACTASLAYAYSLSGRIADVQPLLDRATQFLPLGPSYFCAPSLSWMSEALLLVGNIEAAQQLAVEALKHARDHKERSHQACTLRLYGDIEMHHDPPGIDQAKTHYQQALTLANELGMRPLQAHCHRGLGTLYSQAGQAEQARTELSTAIQMYRDLEMTFWLPETEAAFADVGGKA